MLNIINDLFTGKTFIVNNILYTIITYISPNIAVTGQIIINTKLYLTYKVNRLCTTPYIAYFFSLAVEKLISSGHFVLILVILESIGAE